MVRTEKGYRHCVHGPGQRTLGIQHRLQVQGDPQAQSSLGESPSSRLCSPSDRISSGDPHRRQVKGRKPLGKARSQGPLWLLPFIHSSALRIPVTSKFQNKCCCSKEGTQVHGYQLPGQPGQTDDATTSIKPRGALESSECLPPQLGLPPLPSARRLCAKCPVPTKVPGQRCNRAWLEVPFWGTRSDTEKEKGRIGAHFPIVLCGVKSLVSPTSPTQVE